MNFSEFTNSCEDFNDSRNIDLATAQKVSGGSICDAYKVRQGSRLVFVKHLKEKLIDSPRHRAALAKELEIGTSLMHPSLPVYLYGAPTYIVMNYVEGDTLEKMINDRDVWLNNPKNVANILSSLLSVIIYLHNNNVVHCDIKSDNIIVSKNPTNIHLIDLDKCYTSWLDQTSGAPDKYGLPEDHVGDTKIDYNALGMIAEKLMSFSSARTRKQLLKFQKECFANEINVERLKQLLQQIKEPKNSRRFLFIPLIIAVIVGSCLVFYKVQRRSTENREIYDTTEKINISDTAIPDFLDTIIEKISVSPILRDEDSVIKPGTSSITDDNEFVVILQPLFDRLNEIESIPTDSLRQLSRDELMALCLELVDIHDICQQKGKEKIRLDSPDFSEAEIQNELFRNVTFSSCQMRYVAVTRRIIELINEKN